MALAEGRESVRRHDRGGTETLTPYSRADVPARAGTYALVLTCADGRTVTIGRLGALAVYPGYYVYAGSAFGPGGLAGRLRHHLAPILRPHWHIDYLQPVTQVQYIVYTISNLRCEHTWAHVLQQAPGASLPMKGFGSSDCGCPAHLFRFESMPEVDLPGAVRITAF